MDWKITKQSFMSRTTLFFFSISICLFSLYALFTTINNNNNTKTVCLDIRNPTGTNSDSYFQELEKTEEKIEDDQEVEEAQILSSSIIRRSLFHYSLMSRFSISRRYLSVPGSSPPRCTSKCGKCTPCKPVHVPVPPGTPVTTEYYPEAWRCKCGNKLYMP